MHSISIVLYSVTLLFSVVQLCFAIFILVLIVIQRSHLHEHSTDFVLYANTYLSLLVIAVVLIDLCAYSIYGQLFADHSFDGWWCRAKACLLYMGGMTFFHSFALQAIYRLCRILHGTRVRLHAYRLYASLSGFLWILTFCELVPSLIVGHVEYLHEDHHCQFSPRNIAASATILSIGFFFPFGVTVFCYVWTLIRTHQRTVALTNINQQTSIRRELLILKRLVILLTVVTMVAVPHAAFPTAYLIAGELPVWSVPLEWSFTSSSLLLVALVLPIISPHLKKLWKRVDDVQPVAIVPLSVRH